MLEKLKKNYFILIITFLFIYFFFNLLDGQRGLISYMKKKDIYEQLKNDESVLSNKIANLEHKNSLLTEDIDLDFIEMSHNNGSDIDIYSVSSSSSPLLSLVSSVHH